ncbi:Opbp [Drosophila busckii]|uniref:Opbp n=1 Tax=Drosophila busckii TaxID=30019 RepID=A0A0M4E4K1_DROBS|nr:zinc finger protein 2 homolog [Drosophila busckii]ALC41004.1 Opbp [Drosophila busckii]
MSAQRGNSSNLTLQSHVEAETTQQIDVDQDQFIIDAAANALYYCEDCGQDFDSIAAYNEAHNGTGSCQSHVEIDIKPIVTDDDLIEELEPQMWDVVDEDDREASLATFGTDEVELATEIEMEDEHIEEASSSAERYFCFDCHSIFETRLSAEEHSCPQAEANEELNNKQLNSKAKPQTPVRRKLPTVGSLKNVEANTTCHICKTKLSSAKCLKFHMRIHDKRTTKSIQDALPVGAHQQYSELDQFYCEICDKSFEQNLLTVHKQMHQSQQHFFCGTCNRKFDDIINYEMHLKIHEKSEKATPASNKKKDVGTKDKPGFACQYCDSVFMRPYEKVKHERVHTGEKPYSCEVCGKTFRVSYSLTLHLRTHTNIRPYVCTTCNKRFKSHQVYSHHLRIHNSERQYACDSCPKSFRTSVQLYAHKNTHTKPYQCAVCNRPFASLYAVKTHMKTHRSNDAKNGSNPTSKSQQLPNKYWCETCGAEYARPFALRIHMKEAHGQMDDADTRLTKVTPPDELDTEEELLAPDTETAVLIAAAKADADYLHAGVPDVDVAGAVQKFEDSMQFVVQDFHSEEIITDWLKN